MRNCTQLRTVSKFMNSSNTQVHGIDDYQSALMHEQQCSLAFDNHLYDFLASSPGDWPCWYYVKKIQVDVPQQSPHLFLIPEHEPFHVTLNAHETVVNLHRFLLPSYMNIYLILLYQRSPNQTEFLFLLLVLSWDG